MLLKKYCPSRLPGRRDQPDLNETRFSFFMGILVELYDHSYLSIPVADFYQIFFIQRQRYRDEKKPKTVLFSSDRLFFFAYLLTQISNIQITKKHIQSRRQQ